MMKLKPKAFSYTLFMEKSILWQILLYINTQGDSGISKSVVWITVKCSNGVMQGLSAPS